MATSLLASIDPVYSRVNAHERNGYHTPLINDYYSESKCLLTFECDVALERYRKYRVGLNLYKKSSFAVVFRYMSLSCLGCIGVW